MNNRKEGRNFWLDFNLILYAVQWTFCLFACIKYIFLNQFTDQITTTHFEECTSKYWLYCILFGSCLQMHKYTSNRSKKIERNNGMKRKREKSNILSESNTCAWARFTERREKIKQTADTFECSIQCKILQKSRMNFWAFWIQYIKE